MEQCQDPESVRWTSVPRPYGPEQARAFISAAARGWAQGGNRVWAVEVLDPLTGRPRFAGTIDYRPDGAGAAELGFGLHPAARGRGLMARAARLAITYAFDRGRHRGHALARVRRQLGLPAYGVAVRLPRRGHRPAAPVRERQAVRRLGRLPDQGRADGAGPPLARRAGARGRAGAPAPLARGRRAATVPAARDRAGPPVSSAAFVPATPETFDEVADGAALPHAPRARPSAGASPTSRPTGRSGTSSSSGCAAPAGTVTPSWATGCTPGPRPRRRDARGAGAAAPHAFAGRADGGLGLHRLHARAPSSATPPPRRCCERAGFTRVGTEHAMIALDDGAFADDVLYELLAPADAPRPGAGAGGARGGRGAAAPVAARRRGPRRAGMHRPGDPPIG